MRKILRGFVSSAFTCALLLSCTKPNPVVCCVTALQCDALGIDVPRPCDVGQACKAGGCIASECDTAADCAAESPICANHLCLGTCSTDDDCAEVAGRTHCSAQGMCVGCTSAAQCPSTTAICDMEDQTCRGCEADTECASGVCIEADGVCADHSALIFVSSSGSDAGQCDETAPCLTVAYALGRVAGSRNVIRVLGFEIVAPAAATTIDRNVIIDATGTRLDLPAGGTLFDVRNPAVVTIEGVAIAGGTQSLSVGAASTLRIFGADLQTKVTVSNGTLSVISSKARNSTFNCSGGSMTTTGNHFDLVKVQFTNCQTAVTRNRWDPGLDGSIDGGGGVLAVENNVFVVPSEFADLIRVFNLAPGSIFAFNTIVNSQTIQMSPIALSCDSTLNVTSNIFAYNSSNPIDGCIAQSSLFDLVGAPDAPGNPSADPSTFFVNRAGRDFHLGPSSPARGIGADGVVTTDLDGNPRPAPAGTHPDVGAYEAP